MNSKANPLTLHYNINNINYYAICANNNIYLTKNSDGKTLRINKEDEDILREILKRVQRQKYKFIKHIEYKGQKFKEYLNQIDGLLYFTAQQNNREVACSYDEYSELYNQANFIKRNNLSGETAGGDDSQNSKQWEILDNLSMQNASTETGQQKETTNEDEPLPNEMPEELTKSLDANSKKLLEKFPWVKKVAKIFVTITLSASIALSITACGNAHQTDPLNLDPDSAVIYQIDSIGNSGEPDTNIIEDILHDNGFDSQTIDSVVDDYETRLGINNDDSHNETDLNNEIAKRAINAIENNNNLSKSDKSFLKEMFTPWMSANSAYLDEYCIDRLANLKIIYNTEEGAVERYNASGFTGPLQNDGSVSRIWVGITHIDGKWDLQGVNLGIVINNTDPNSIDAKETLAHEFIHVLIPNWPEGMVELYNPNKSTTTSYKQQQLTMIMLEEIYGESTIKEAFLRDNTLSTLAENEDEANLFRNLLFGMSSDFGDSGIGLADFFEPLESLYETKHPEEKASENLVFNLCKDILNRTNTSGIAEEGESIDYFIYKGDKLYVACNHIAQNDVSPILEGLGLQETQYARISRLVPIE